MSEEYIEVFLKELESSKQEFEQEKESYENVRSLVTQDIKAIEQSIRPITEYISSHYSTISYVRQVDDYEQLNVTYKEDLLLGYRFVYDKAQERFFINVTGGIGQADLTVKVFDDKCVYVKDSKELTIDEVIEKHIKAIAAYVAEDNYRVR